MRGLTLYDLANSRATIVENPLKFVNWFERMAAAFKVLGMYLIRIIWPVNNLSSDYSYNQIPTTFNLFGWEMWLGIIIFSLMIVGVCLAFKKKRAPIILILASSFFLFFYLPTSNLIFPIGTIMAERLMYIPSLAACLLLGAGLILLRSRLRSKKYGQCLYLSIILIIIIFYGFVSFNRNFDWRNEAALFASAASRSPNSVLSRSNQGAMYLLAGKLELAEQEILAAQKIYDNYNHNLNNLGLLYLKQNKLDQARSQLEFTLTKYPSYGPAIDNLALTCFKLGEYRKAGKLWTVIYGHEAAQLYLKAYFSSEFAKLVKENNKTGAKSLFIQASKAVKDKKWLREIKEYLGKQ